MPIHTPAEKAKNKKAAQTIKTTAKPITSRAKKMAKKKK